MYLGQNFGKGVVITLKDKKSVKQAIRDKCILFIQEYIETPLSSADMVVLLQQLTDIGIRASKGQEYNSLGAVITHLGYKLEWHGNKNNGFKKSFQSKLISLLWASW